MPDKMPKKDKPGIGLVVCSKLSSPFVKKKNPQAILSKPVGETGVSKLRKAKSAGDMKDVAAKHSPDQEQGHQVSEVAPPLPPMPQQFRTNLPSQPTSYSTSSICFPSSADPDITRPRLPRQPSAPALRNRKSKAKLRPAASARNLKRTVHKDESVADFLDRINNGPASTEEHNNLMDAQRWIDSTEDRYLLQHASAPIDPSRASNKKGREAGTLSRDLSNLENFSIRLTIRLFDIASSLNISLLRNVEAYQVPSLGDLRSYVNAVSSLELRRPAVKISFAFEDGRKLDWEVGTAEDKDKIYQ